MLLWGCSEARRLWKVRHLSLWVRTRVRTSPFRLPLASGSQSHVLRDLEQVRIIFIWEKFGRLHKESGLKALCWRKNRLFVTWQWGQGGKSSMRNGTEVEKKTTILSSPDCWCLSNLPSGPVNYRMVSSGTSFWLYSFRTSFGQKGSNLYPKLLGRKGRLIRGKRFGEQNKNQRNKDWTWGLAVPYLSIATTH